MDDPDVCESVLYPILCPAGEQIPGAPLFPGAAALAPVVFGYM